MNQFDYVAAYLSSPHWCLYNAQCRVSLTFLEQFNCAFSWINKDVLYESMLYTPYTSYMLRPLVAILRDVHYKV